MKINKNNTYQEQRRVVRRMNLTFGGQSFFYPKHPAKPLDREWLVSFINFQPLKETYCWTYGVSSLGSFSRVGSEKRVYEKKNGLYDVDEDLP